MSFWDQFDLQVFVDALYAQGVQALASLAEPEVIDCAPRLYATTNAYRTAAPSDLLRALEMFIPNARQRLEAYGARF